MSAEHATITAVVPTRNRPQLLRRALRSILSQEDARVSELIVVYDQAEPDVDLPSEFAAAPLRIASNHRTPGLAGARNTGIDLATGEWVAFCDDDDEWTTDRLARQQAALDDHVDMVVGGIRIAYGGREVMRTPGGLWIDFDRLLRSRVMAAHSSTYLLRRSALTGNLGYVDEHIPGGYGEDYDLLLRAARIRPIRVIDAPIATVHWHASSFYLNHWETILEAIEYLIDKTPELERSRAGLARLRGQQAFAAAGLGDRQEALHRAGETFRLDPRQLRTYLTLAVVGGISAERLVKIANTVGRGI